MITCQQFMELVQSDVLHTGSKAEYAACINHYGSCADCRRIVIDAAAREIADMTVQQMIDVVVNGMARNAHCLADEEFRQTIQHTLTNHGPELAGER